MPMLDKCLFIHLEMTTPEVMRMVMAMMMSMMCSCAQSIKSSPCAEPGRDGAHARRQGSRNSMFAGHLAENRLRDYYLIRETVFNRLNIAKMR